MHLAPSLLVLALAAAALPGTAGAQTLTAPRDLTKIMALCKARATELAQREAETRLKRELRQALGRLRKLRDLRPERPEDAAEREAAARVEAVLAANVEREEEDLARAKRRFEAAAKDAARQACQSALLRARTAVRN